MTIPEIRHCLHALANKLDVEDGVEHPGRAEVAAILRYLAEQTRRAPRGSRKGGGQDEPPEQQAAAE